MTVIVIPRHYAVSAFIVLATLLSTAAYAATPTSTVTASSSTPTP